MVDALRMVATPSKAGEPRCERVACADAHREVKMVASLVMA